MTRALMFQGTGSDVGKSLVVAGLCRLFARRGMRVAPFKSQNMSNNAAVADDGGEIGRAQWLQAFAAGVAPSVHMNPVLLKPQSDRISQVIVRGQMTVALSAQEYQSHRATLLPAVMESYRKLAKNTDLILVEGAGSPAEINLRQHDIANMGFARAVSCPVVLVGDIDRGGVIASLVGTQAILSEPDRTTIRGFIVNKFRGDAALFTQGMAEITRFTGWPALGLVPYHGALAQLPQEDSLALHKRGQSCTGALHIAVLVPPHIANFDDLDPLQNEPAVRLTWCREGDAIPHDAALVILPGSKSTIADLAFVRAQGWDEGLRAHLRRGGRVLGICGGLQMLGMSLSDPHGMEGEVREAAGLGLLDLRTVFHQTKIVAPWSGRSIDGGESVAGYEIHCGASDGADCARPVFADARGPEGARSADGLVWGTYVHGLFANDGFRGHFLAQLGAPPSDYRYWPHLRTILDGWADVLEQAISTETLLSLAAPVQA